MTSQLLSGVLDYDTVSSTTQMLQTFRMESKIGLLGSGRPRNEAISDVATRRWNFMGKATITGSALLLVVGALLGDEGDLDDEQFEFKRLNDKYQADIEALEVLGHGNEDELVACLPKHLRQLIDDKRQHEKDEEEQREKEREEALVKRIEEALKADAASTKKADGGALSRAEAGLSPGNGGGETKTLKASEAIRRRAPRVFTLNYMGDMKASATSTLRDVVSLLKQVAQPGVDEVVVCLNSGGGLVSEYGLAASQLQRLRDANIHLTVCIDVVGASGGYMMAAVADHIVAAPFAAVGSIGVVCTIPNVAGVLEKAKVDVLEFTSGKYKRTVTPYGKANDEMKEKMQEEISEIHGLMKDAIGRARPSLDMEAVATGEVWLGAIALEKGLVDKVATSDEYLHCKVWPPRRASFMRACSSSARALRVFHARGVARPFFSIS